MIIIVYNVFYNFPIHLLEHSENVWEVVIQLHDVIGDVERKNERKKERKKDT